jgi:hypothetical protein
MEKETINIRQIKVIAYPKEPLSKKDLAGWGSQD